MVSRSLANSSTTPGSSTSTTFSRTRRKGGGFVIPSFGNFDSVNPFIRKGRKATGMDYTTALIYERLMFKADDEPSSQYGWLAESVLLADDLKSITRMGGMLNAKPKGARSRWSG
jgi:hypothetical protein